MRGQRSRSARRNATDSGKEEEDNAETQSTHQARREAVASISSVARDAHSALEMQGEQYFANQERAC
jgi:hypothetical protein